MQTTACEECGLIINQPDVDMEHEYYCPRCKALTYRSGQEFKYIIMMAISALIFFIPAITLPILTLNIAGISQNTTLIQAVWAFFGDGYASIAVLVLFTGIIVPLLMLLLILSILLPIHFHVPPKKIAPFFLMYEELSAWSMGEVYLISILVAIIKLQKMAELTIGVGLYLFSAFLITMFISIVWFNPHDIWHIDKSNSKDSS